MATWETTSASTHWQNSGTLANGSAVLKITDGQNDTVMKAGESVTISIRNQLNDITGTFAGSVTVDGVEYPVVHWNFFGSTVRIIVGLDSSTTSTKTLADSALDTSDFTVCFFPGTLIATPFGERKVEELVSGNPVLVGDTCASPATWQSRMGRKFRIKLGFSRAVPVKWIGRQTISTRFGPAERLMPVRFVAGSLGQEGGTLLPHSELTVTADHAMLVDGVLCEAGALVNGTTITRVPLSEFGESYTVYHVETAAHEIVFANGAPAETFVDSVSRRAFENYAEFENLYGDQPEMRELAHPRASNARHLPLRIKKRLGICKEAGLTKSA